MFNNGADHRVTHVDRCRGLQRRQHDVERNLPDDFIYSAQYMEFLSSPEKCNSATSFYRDSLPQRDAPLPMTYEPAKCEALHFFHKWYGGLFVLIGIVALVSSFLFGIVWGKYKDSSLGWTIGLSGGAVVIAYLTLLATLYCK